MRRKKTRAWISASNRRRRRPRGKNNLPPGNTRAIVLAVCVLLLLVAKLVFAQEADPSSSSATADSLVRAAREHADEKRFGDAAAALRQALVARPGDRTAWSLLARVLAWDRRYDESIATYRELLAAHPDDTFDRTGYARVLAWSGRHAESIREFRRAAAADSTNPEARIGLARAMAWSGDLPGAAIEYRRLLRQNPRYGDAWLGEATIARWRGAATAADARLEKAAANGAEPAALAEERAAVDRALSPVTSLGWFTSRERQRASGAPDYTIEETGPYGAARAVIARSVNVGARYARTHLYEHNQRTTPGDTTLNYDLTSRALRFDASFLRGYPLQLAAGLEFRGFDARGDKVLYPLTGDDTFTGWNARAWTYWGRFTPGLTARRTFLAIKDWNAATSLLEFEPGHLTDLEGNLGWQWNARGTASVFATTGETSDDNGRWRAGGNAGYKIKLGRPTIRLDYGLTFADWDRRSPSYFTPLASTRHAIGGTLSGWASPGDVDYGVRYEFSHLESSNFADIETNGFSGWLNGIAGGRFPLSLEGSYTVDNNDYETWYLGVSAGVRW